MFKEMIPAVLVLIPAGDFDKLEPVPWEAQCRVVGQSASPRLVCELPLKPAADKPKDKKDDKKES